MSGERRVADADEIFCGGAITACRSHIIFDAIEVYLPDGERLWMLESTMQVTVWPSNAASA
ncbi:hypothetical protein [Aliagarivorans taiwanensis]|uniref:hypothetical protein n=1 Tax=Aliagarivorans taiwanensis TaxID=561966 RepID=UPI000425247A|nr:hypothetical protein [Aliagarivorans taiwanensis]